MIADRTLVIAPLREEIAALVQRVHVEHRRRIDSGAKLILGHLGSRPIALCVCGDGPIRARRSMESLLEHGPVKRIVMIGVAGALSPQLRLRDLAVAREIVSEEGARHVPNPVLADAAEKECGAIPAIAVTTRDLTLGPGQRARLSRNGSASFVDLESSIFAEVASKIGAPYVVLRAMSDTAEEPLPPLIARCLDREGSVRRTRVLARALCSPSTWSPLARLAIRVRACSQRLADAVEALEACASS
jgi:adenosylhomocysteine nucleosidase